MPEPTPRDAEPEIVPCCDRCYLRSGESVAMTWDPEAEEFECNRHVTPAGLRAQWGGNVNDDEPTYSLLMPFVICESQGGPHDDAAFGSGYRLGLLDASLCALPDEGIVTPLMENEISQADLIAMKNKRTMTTETAEHGWVICSFTASGLNGEGT